MPKIGYGSALAPGAFLSDAYFGGVKVVRVAGSWSLRSSKLPRRELEIYPLPIQESLENGVKMA